MKRFLSILLLLLLIFTFAAQALAQDLTEVKSSSGGTMLQDPLGLNGDIEGGINKMLTYILGFVGVLALIAFIYGGLLWMLSRGDTAVIKKGKDMMVWAVLGLAVIFSSYAFLTFVFEALLQK